MKKLLKNKYFFIIIISFSAELFADTFGFINLVKKENAFLVAPDHSASIVKNGDFLEADSQLLVEEGGLVIFSDYFDHKYQLSSGSLVKFKSEGIELIRGSIRIKTLAPSGKIIKIETPNAITVFSDSEGVLSYDHVSNQTDLVSFDGVFEFRGKNNQNSSIDVNGGNSSFVRRDFQMGMPSIASKSTPKELEKIASVFLDSSIRTRGMASTPQEGKIIVIRKKAPKSSKSRKRGLSSKVKPSVSVPIRIMGSRGPSSEAFQTNKTPKAIEPLLKDLKSYQMEP